MSNFALPGWCTSYAPCDTCKHTPYKSDTEFKVRVWCSQCGRWNQSTHWSFDIFSLNDLDLASLTTELLFKYGKFIRLENVEKTKA